MKQLKIGFFVNPVSGVGGPLGLKGSDSENIWSYINSVSELSSFSRTSDMLDRIDSNIFEKFRLITSSGYLGEYVINDKNIDYDIVYTPEINQTTKNDTVNLLHQFIEHNVDLILYAGGDGTSVVVQSVIKDTIPVIAIPVGVKMYSGIFPLSPIHSANIFNEYINSSNREYILREISDLDDTLITEGETGTKFSGYLKTPLISNLDSTLQESKGGSIANEKDELENLIEDFNEKYDMDSVYLMGPGSTINSITTSRNLSGTLLGFDILHKNKIIKNDCSENDIFEYITHHKNNIYLVVTIIGNQGFLFGRGNQQISSRILDLIDNNNILIYATKSKLDSLETDILIDIGNSNTNNRFGKYINVISGYKFSELKKCKSVYF